MLVLSRKKGESIIIGDNITVMVISIRNDKVRLGIDAPAAIPVHRREVFDAIQFAQSKVPIGSADGEREGRCRRRLLRRIR